MDTANLVEIACSVSALGTADYRYSQQFITIRDFKPKISDEVSSSLPLT